MKLTSLLFIAVVSISSFGFAQTVTIGTQTWTALNLDVATFRNGDPITQAKTNDEWQAAGDNKRPAWCYYDNDPKNGAKYGKLYNWYAVKDARGLAPSGWHIPTDQEWTVLDTFLGGVKLTGYKMKSISGWGLFENGTNISGFTGLPGGYRAYGEYHAVGNIGDWWSASECFNYGAWSLILCDICSGLGRANSSKDAGLSVRCVKD